MRASTARTRYGVVEKAGSRDLVLALAQDIHAETILDLWGGGASARAFREVVPQAAVVSSESDPELWPSLRLDAQLYGYVPHMGDVTSVKGHFDLIWLDLCSQWCGAARTVIHQAASKLNEGGSMAVTLLAARETPEIAADRLFLVPRSIERATGMHIQLLYPYQTGSPMWLLLLRPQDRRSFWTDVPERTVVIKGRNPDNWVWKMASGSPYDMVLEDLKTQGFFASPFDGSDRVCALLEATLAARVA